MDVTLFNVIKCLAERPGSELNFQGMMAIHSFENELKWLIKNEYVYLFTMKTKLRDKQIEHFCLKEVFKELNEDAELQKEEKEGS